MYMLYVIYNKGIIMVKVGDYYLTDDYREVVKTTKIANGHIYYVYIELDIEFNRSENHFLKHFKYSEFHNSKVGQALRSSNG